MPRDVPSLDDRQRSLIVETISGWAKAHPRRDLPIVGLADGSELTPIEIAEALADPNSSRGQFLFRVFAAGLIDDRVEEAETLDQILDDYRHDTHLWRNQVDRT